MIRLTEKTSFWQPRTVPNGFWVITLPIEHSGAFMCAQTFINQLITIYGTMEELNTNMFNVSLVMIIKANLSSSKYVSGEISFQELIEFSCRRSQIECYYK